MIRTPLPIGTAARFVLAARVTDARLSARLQDVALRASLVSPGKV